MAEDTGMILRNAQAQGLIDPSFMQSMGAVMPSLTQAGGMPGLNTAGMGQGAPQPWDTRPSQRETEYWHPTKQAWLEGPMPMFERNRWNMMQGGGGGGGGGGKT